MCHEERLNELLEVWRTAWARGRDIPVSDLCPDAPQMAAALEARIRLIRHATVTGVPPHLWGAEAAGGVTAAESRAAAGPTSAPGTEPGFAPTLTVTGPSANALVSPGGPAEPDGYGSGETQRTNGEPAAGPGEAATLTRVGPDSPAHTRVAEGSGRSWDYSTRPDTGVPVIPGYDVLDLLGRGGNGVVYKARHLALDRVVAIKMLLPGLHARASDLVRLRFEAEVLARLNHPNIVEVYDVGELAGQPYLVLEYVDGGNLDRFARGNPLPPGRAAALVEEIARAVDCAHRQYVVHRDLKPANVLMTRDGRPKVTDFGLAKQLGDDGRQTHTDAVLGTPSYMSPEQAAGRTKDVGPAADVYALGAILYDVLTGRPPFMGETVMATLEKVLREEPVPPRRVRPDVPPDLQTISLKCLQKDPLQRYASAEALAEDLRRFRAGEPILARPTSAHERAVKWARRNPAAAALAAVSGAAAVTLLALSLWFNARLGEELASTRTAWAQAEAEHERADRQEADRRARLAALRADGQSLLLKGQAAGDRGEWDEARGHLTTLLAVVGPEPELADLRDPGDRLLADVTRRLADRGRYARFVRRRDDAMFHGTLLTGVDPAAELAATRAAAGEALALYGLADGAGGARLEGLHLSGKEETDVRDGCYELLLVLAEATARPVPGASAEDQHLRAGQALAVLDRAATLRAPTKAYRLRRAGYLEQLGDEPRAAEERDLAAGLPADGATDLYLVGDGSFKRGQLADAASSFEAALRRDPGHFWARYFLAVCYLRLQRPAEARALLGAGLGERAGFAWVYLLRGVAAGELGLADAAEADFDRAEAIVRADPDPAARYGVLVNRGAVRLRLGKAADAAADFRRAIDLMPGQYQAYTNLADACRKLGQPEEAAEHIDRAIGLAPAVAAGYRLRAEIRRDHGDLAGAVRDFEAAARHEPEASALAGEDHFERGRLLHRQRQYIAALAAYDAALRVNPDHPAAYRVRAEVLVALGRGRDALASLDRCLEKDTRDADAYRLRGFERARVGDHAGALADYARSLEIDPTSAVARARRGWALLDAREAAKQALEDFDQATRREPGNGELYNGRGYARVLLGEYEKGVEDVKEAIRLGPGGTDPRERPALLYNAACVYARASACVARLRPADQPALAGDYRDRAVGLLREGLALLPPPARAAYVRQALADPAFEDLRQTDAFKAVVAPP